jgi:hypothetical protein
LPISTIEFVSRTPSCPADRDVEAEEARKRQQQQQSSGGFIAPPTAMAVAAAAGMQQTPMSSAQHPMNM